LLLLVAWKTIQRCPVDRQLSEPSRLSSGRGINVNLDATRCGDWVMVKRSLLGKEYGLWPARRHTKKSAPSYVIDIPMKIFFENCDHFCGRGWSSYILISPSSFGLQMQEMSHQFIKPWSITESSNLSGVIVLPTQTLQYQQEIPENCHSLYRFALLDAPKMGPMSIYIIPVHCQAVFWFLGSSTKRMFSNLSRSSLKVPNLFGIKRQVWN